MTVSEQKQAQRRAGRAARRALSVQARAAANAALCANLWQLDAVQNAQTILLYAAVPGPDGWEVGQYGIRTPILSRSEILLPEALDLVLVPCTAFDADCFRVGMGKGYYDRFLPRCTHAGKIGIAFEAQRVARAAVDGHDQRLDAYVTERGIYQWK